MKARVLRIRRSRPRFSLVHSSCHAFLTKSKFAWLLADRKCGIWVCAAFLRSRLKMADIMWPGASKAANLSVS